jgi:hypothetical protein
MLLLTFKKGFVIKRFLRWIVNFLRKSFGSTAGIYGDAHDASNPEPTQNPKPEKPDEQPPRTPPL